MKEAWEWGYASIKACKSFDPANTSTELNNIDRWVCFPQRFKYQSSCFPYLLCWIQFASELISKCLIFNPPPQQPHARFS